jgi:hypothetical protein
MCNFAVFVLWYEYHAPAIIRHLHASELDLAMEIDAYSGTYSYTSRFISASCPNRNVRRGPGLDTLSSPVL